MRSQPAIDQGAWAASKAACPDKARARPTPPSRKVALYGPKLAADGPDDSAGQTVMLSQSAHNARPQIKRFHMSALGKPYDNADTLKYPFFHFFDRRSRATPTSRCSPRAAPPTAELSASRV